MSLGCSVTVGPAEPKNKSSAIGDYPPATFKRAKPDHTGLRTLNAYGTSTTHPHYHHHQYGPSANADMMHTFFQQYGTGSGGGGGSAKGPYSNAQQSYWSGSHEDAAAVWQSSSSNSNTTDRRRQDHRTRNQRSTLRWFSFSRALLFSSCF